MKQKRKSRFFTFIFSFLPGAAEMYMGFLKNGLTLMLIFFVSFLPMGFIDILGPLSMISAVIWFFGFFHARNIAGLSDIEFMALEDKYIWDEFSDFKHINFASDKVRKWIAVILIFLGIAQLWNYLSDTIYRLIPENLWDMIYPVVRDVPKIVVAVLFVLFGIYLIVGKKKELDLSPNVVVTHINEIPQEKETDCKDDSEKAPEAEAETAIETAPENAEKEELTEVKEA